MSNVIPLRTKIESTIFDEMAEKYPTVNHFGREYKQNSTFFSIQTDFDFGEFYYCMEDCEVSPSIALNVFMYLNCYMCSSNGYYLIYTRSFSNRLKNDLQLESVDAVNKIIDALVLSSYVFRFDDKLVTVHSVRTFETIQSRRKAKRDYYDNKNKKAEPESVESDNVVVVDDKSVIKELEEDNEDIKFFNSLTLDDGLSDDDGQNVF